MSSAGPDEAARPRRAARCMTFAVVAITGLWGDFIAWLRGPIAGYTLPL